MTRPDAYLTVGNGGEKETDSKDYMKTRTGGGKEDTGKDYTKGGKRSFAGKSITVRTTRRVTVSLAALRECGTAGERFCALWLWNPREPLVDSVKLHASEL